MINNFFPLNAHKNKNKIDLKQRRLNSLKRYLRKTVNITQITHLKNYCEVSLATHSYCGYFGLSRHYLRRYVNFALIPGVTKSSW
jgi:ribosomal protein S14